MNNKSLDPAGHVSLAVSNLGRSRKFYKSLFDHLEFKLIREVAGSAAWVTREGFGIWVRQAKHSRPRHKHFAPGLHHLCLKAKRKKVVDEIQQLMLSKKAFIHDQARAYPEYTPKYYAVMFADPDGIIIEVAYY